MKRLLLFAGMVLAPLMAQASDFQVAVLRKKANVTRAKQAQSGETNKKTESYFYQVTVTNRAFKESPALTAKYVIFVERQELAAKAGTEQLEKVKGEGTVAALKPHGKTSFDTKEVTLREQGLHGGWVYTSGGRIKATDSLVGIWVKLYDGTQEVGQYINPTTLSDKHHWD